MKLSEINWQTITETQAGRLVGVASKREKIMGQKFNRGECTEAEWLEAFTLWEDLMVFSRCVERRATLSQLKQSSRPKR